MGAKVSAATTGSTRKYDYEMDLPPWWDPGQVDKMFRYIPYEQREEEALSWRKQFEVSLAATDSFRLAVLPIDMQNTFIDPLAQLFVAGRSGRGSIDDTRRAGEWVLRNGRVITTIAPTMDTHMRAQIFCRSTYIGPDGKYPPPNTPLQLADFENGKWDINPAICASYGNPNGLAWLKAYVLHYLRTLSEQGKYNLMVWAYHAMLGGLEHALVPAAHEVFWWHNCLRDAATDFQIKGGNRLSENYSIVRPEILVDHLGRSIAQRNEKLLKALFEHDMVVIFGQAKSHCVAWTIQDILETILKIDRKLAEKIYLVEDLTSSVVIRDAGGEIIPFLDFTEQGDAAFKRFADAGMHRVQSTVPIKDWGGVASKIAA